MSSNNVKVIFNQKITSGDKINNLFIIRVFTKLAVFVAYVLLPVWPLLFSIVFANSKFILNYRQTIKALLIYFAALKEGPIEHYFADVISNENVIPSTIKGSCIKCGNCCLDRRCIFLEKTGEEEYICGIYTSPLRRFSNCNSFPLNARDIERYSCPSFTEVAIEQPISPFDKTEYKTS